MQLRPHTWIFAVLCMLLLSGCQTGSPSENLSIRTSQAAVPTMVAVAQGCAEMLVQVKRPCLSRFSHVERSKLARRTRRVSCLSKELIPMAFPYWLSRRNRKATPQAGITPTFRHSAPCCRPETASASRMTSGDGAWGASPANDRLKPSLQKSWRGCGFQEGTPQPPLTLGKLKGFTASFAPASRLSSHLVANLDKHQQNISPRSPVWLRLPPVGA